MGQIFERLCAMNQVRVRLNVGGVPAPDSSHNLAWVRRTARSLGWSEPHLLAFTTCEIQTTWRQGPRETTMNVVASFRHMYIGNELTRYRGAADRAQVHEAGHPRDWQASLLAGMPDICTDLNSRIFTMASTRNQRDALLHQVELVARQAKAGFRVTLQAIADRWDMQDYPALQRALAGMGVPPGL